MFYFFSVFDLILKANPDLINKSINAFLSVNKIQSESNTNLYPHSTNDSQNDLLNKPRTLISQYYVDEDDLKKLLLTPLSKLKPIKKRWLGDEIINSFLYRFKMFTDAFDFLDSILAKDMIRLTKCNYI